MWFKIFSANKQKEDSAAQEDHAPETPDMEPVPATYDALMRRSRVHRLDIRIDPDSLPRIALIRKPASDEYLPLKHKLVNAALERLRPYLDYCESLPGMSGNPRVLLENIVRAFLVRYWDMPSSADNHHAYPWGHCLHSLDVACGEAELASAWTPMNTVGIDEITKSRYRCVMILASFAKGLVHDGYKIYQYRLTGLRGEVREAFDPCLKDGTVLDFKLVHPSGLNWDWQTEIRMPGRRNMLEFLEIVPRELLKSMPVEINSAIIANICDMDTCDADQESASRDLRCKNGMETRSTVLNAVRDYFTRAPGRARPADTVFYINEQWCAVAMPAFFKQLLPLPGFRDVSSVCQYLGYENTLAEQSAELFLASVAFQCAKDGKTFRHEKMSLAFLRTDYLRKAVANEVDGLAVATFCLEDAAALSAIGIPDSFFSKWPDPPKKENNSAGAQGTESGQQSDPARTSLPGSAQPASVEPEKKDAQIVQSAVLSAASSPAVPQPVTPEPEQPATETNQPDAKALELTGMTCGARFRLMAGRSSERDLRAEGGWLACRDDAAFLRSPEFPRALFTLLGQEALCEDAVAAERLHQLLLSTGLVLPGVLESVECDVPDLIAGTFTRTVLKGQFWPLSPSAMRQVAIMQKIAGGTHAPA